MVEIKMWIHSDDVVLLAEFAAKIKAAKEIRANAQWQQRQQIEKETAAAGGPTLVPVPPAGAENAQDAAVAAAVQAKSPTIVNEPKASVFTEEDVANATRELAQKKGIDAASALLKSFEIARARDLPVEKRTAYIEQAKALQAVSE